MCDCGNTIETVGYYLVQGDTKSCGCLQRETVLKLNTTHGKSKTCLKEYRAWKAMKARCLNPNNPSYLIYGGRGIKVCKRWINSFENFYKDMGSAPDLKRSLDRKNSNGNYTPKNCRWATVREQTSNRCIDKRYEYDGKSLTKSEWARLYGIPFARLHSRLWRGWDFETALTAPIRFRRRRQQ